MQQPTTEVSPATPFYMAFLSSEELYQQSMQYINQAKELTIDQRREMLIEILLRFTDESLQAQFLNYLDIMKVRPVAQKAITGCTSTIKKASVPLIKKITSGMSEAELDSLGDFMKRVIVGVDGSSKGYVGYPITTQVVDGLQEVIQGVRAGDGPAHIDQLQHVLVEMTRCAYYTFFEEPLGALELGRVKRKLTDVALKVCRSATLTLISSVFKGMPQKELEAVVGYLEQMLYENNQST